MDADSDGGPNNMNTNMLIKLIDPPNDLSKHLSYDLSKGYDLSKKPYDTADTCMRTASAPQTTANGR